MALQKFTHTTSEEILVGSTVLLTLDPLKYGALNEIAGTVVSAATHDSQFDYTICYEGDSLPDAVSFIAQCDVTVAVVSDANEVANWIRSNQNFTFSSAPGNGPFNDFATAKDGSFVLMYNKATDDLDMYDISSAGTVTAISETLNSTTTSLASGSWGAESIALTNNNTLLVFADDNQLREYSFTNGTDLSGGLTLNNSLAIDSTLLAGYTIGTAISIDINASNQVLIMCEGDDGGGSTHDTFLLTIDSSGDITTLANSHRRTVPNPTGGFPWIGATLLPLKRMLLIESRNISSNDLFLYDWLVPNDFTASVLTQVDFDSLTVDSPGVTGPPANWASTYKGSVQYIPQTDTVWYSEVVNTSTDEHRIFNIRNATFS